MTITTISSMMIRATKNDFKGVMNSCKTNTPNKIVEIVATLLMITVISHMGSVL